MNAVAETYDLAIVGGGPGGYVAAIRAGQLGLRTAVVEKEPSLGGVCLNWGCIPTKALIKNAEVVSLITGHAQDFGLTFSEFSADWGVAVKRSQKVKGRLTKGIEGLFKKHNVTWWKGRARFTGPRALEVEGTEGGASGVLEATSVIIATGSRSRMLPGVQADGQKVITSRHAVRLDDVPKRLLVAGAGAVGMEFAFVYNAYGADVTVIEMMDRVLPLEDPEVSEVVASSFQRSGIKLRTGSRVEAVDTSGDGVTITVSGEGGQETLEGDRALMAIARVPNTEELGLDAAGVELNERGWVRVDDHLRTTADGVFAIGDVAGPPMLAHKAMHEGVMVAEQLAGMAVHPLDASFIPMCTYCQPQVASIGLSEARAREAGHEVKVSKFPWVGIGKAVAIGETGGFIKIVADARYGEILGATIVGPEATEIIHELVLARTAELTVDEIVATIHAHPTLSEGIHEAGLGVAGLPIHI
jgi:dihydrolipoamide dehydrogenase